MTDDHPWNNAARHARDAFGRHVVYGPAGPDRDALASAFQQAENWRGFRRAVSSGHANDQSALRSRHLDFQHPCWE
jgi:hypothetical protein